MFHVFESGCSHSLTETVLRWTFHGFSSLISLLDLWNWSPLLVLFRHNSASHCGFGYILQTWGPVPPFQNTLGLFLPFRCCLCCDKFCLDCIALILWEVLSPYFQVVCRTPRCSHICPGPWIIKPKASEPHVESCWQLLHSLLMSAYGCHFLSPL